MRVLRDLNEVQEKYEQQHDLDRATVDEEERRRILELASDFPKLWHDSRTWDRQRKRMARLLIEDVTLTKGEVSESTDSLRGGASRELKLSRPRNAWQRRRTDPEVIQQIDRLLDRHTDGGTAEELNRRGFRSGEGLSFNGRS